MPFALRGECTRAIAYLVRRYEVRPLDVTFRALRPAFPQHATPLPGNADHGGGHPAESRPHPRIVEGTEHPERQDPALFADGLVVPDDEGVQPAGFCYTENVKKKQLADRTLPARSARIDLSIYHTARLPSTPVCFGSNTSLGYEIIMYSIEPESGELAHRQSLLSSPIFFVVVDEGCVEPTGFSENEGWYVVQQSGNLGVSTTLVSQVVRLAEGSMVLWNPKHLLSVESTEPIARRENPCSIFRGFDSTHDN